MPADSSMPAGSSRTANPDRGRGEVDEATWSGIAPYLPAPLVDAVRRHPERGGTWIDPLEGTLLFADVSGFTALSERLASTGREGAEQLTEVISRYFRGMLDIALEFGGANLKFGGDALLLLFTDEGHAGRAIAAALGMQRATRRFGAVRAGRGRVRLSMSIGLHSGTLWLASAGLPGRRMQHFVLGGEASRVAEVEAAASAGEVFITQATLDMAGDLPIVEPRGEVYSVVRLRRRSAGRSSTGDEALPAPPSAGRLLAFVPPPLARALSSGDRAEGMESEHRKVSIAFIHLDGVDELLDAEGPEALLGELQRYLSSLVELTERYGGFLVGNDIDAHGIKLIVLFGAPVAHEDDSENALRLALQLNRELAGPGLRLRHRIGINSGFVFAGDVGAPYRREYTVMGDAVNLAARLMGSASAGQILVSAEVAAEGGPGFVARVLKPIRVKGKREPVSICSLEGERATAVAPVFEQTALVGREDEFRLLRRRSREAERGRPRTVVISGEAGIGKSRLARELEIHVRGRGWAMHRGGCYSHTAGSPFAPWVPVLNSLLGVDEGGTTRERTASVVAAVGRLAPELADMASLLNGLFALTIPESDIVRSLDGETRRLRLFELVTGLLRAVSAESAVMVFLEDLHYADHSSIELVNHVSANERPSRLLMCLTMRPKDDLDLALRPASTTAIALGELAPDAAGRLVSAMLDVPALPGHVGQAIVSRARGNPLFLEEVARSMRESGTLDQVLSASSSRLAEEMAVVEIPDRVQTLIMSRIDALSRSVREVLRAAAVIGRSFGVPALRSLVGRDADDASVVARLDDLVRHDIVRVEQGGEAPVYGFRHALAQEVCYESLPFARRREFHHRVASHLERAHEGQLQPVYETLVHHYRHSGDRANTLFYSVRAADKARGVFATAEAIEYYRLGLDNLERSDGQAVCKRSCLFDRIGDCHEVSGRHAEAARAFSRALREWRAALRADARPAIPAVMADDTPARAREAALLLKIGTAHERNSDYDSSLRWLGSALQALPPRHPLQAAQITVARSVSLFRKGAYEEAVQWGRRGLALARRAGTPGLVAYAHDMLASSYLEMGRLKPGVRHKLAAVRLYEELRDLPGMLVAHNNLGTSYQMLGDLDQALNHYGAAIEAGERVGNVNAVAVVHNNIGEVLLIQGRWADAVEHFERTVEAFEQDRDPHAASGLALVNLSRASQRQGFHGRSLDYLRRGMGILRRKRARGLLTEARLQQADLRLEMGENEPALRACRQALGETRELGMRVLEARGLRVFGRIALANGRVEQAESSLRESVALARRHGADYETALTLLCLAELYGMNGGHRGVRRQRGLALRQAIAIFQTLRAEGDLPRALRMQAQEVA
ncbi:MAG: tetratricopeptide repeat protein [Chloroflexi bacterium]|nr:tetratricopeptide repeat protein [Chloroflexota bacterium]